MLGYASDWPLSREEKKRVLVKSFENELAVANQIISTSERERERNALKFTPSTLPSEMPCQSPDKSEPEPEICWTPRTEQEHKPSSPMAQLQMTPESATEDDKDHYMPAQQPSEPDSVEMPVFEIFGQKGWTTLDSEASKIIAAAMADGRKSCEYEITGTRYSFDVLEMQQTNMTTGALRPVRQASNRINPTASHPSPVALDQLFTQQIDTMRRMMEKLESERDAFMRKSEERGPAQSRSKSEAAERRCAEPAPSALRKRRHSRGRVRFEDDSTMSAAKLGAPTTEEEKEADGSDALPKTRQESDEATTGSLAKSVATGGSVGLAGGTVAGGAAGLILAPFTLGLSIPFGLIVGGTTGTITGSVIGTGYHAITGTPSK